MDPGDEVVKPSVKGLTWADLDKRKYYTYGPLVFLHVRLITHPLMVLKTQVQMQVGSQHSIADSVKNILRGDGIRGFYKGFGVSALNIVVSQIYITLFEFGRSEAVQGARPEALRNFLAGTFAVLTSQLVGNPVDVIANRVMASGGIQHVASHSSQASTRADAPKPPSFSYKNAGLWNGGALRAVRHIVAVEGWRGLMHGYSASVALHAPSSGLWWAMYAVTRPAAIKLIPENSKHSYWHQRAAEMVCGVVSGSVTAIVLNPLDVVRTRVQVSGKSVTTVIKETLLHDGVKGFAKGMQVRMMLLGGNGAILISAYELVKRLAQRD